MAVPEYGALGDALRDGYQTYGPTQPDGYLVRRRRALDGEWEMAVVRIRTPLREPIIIEGD
jgi:hypothetical protein